MINIPRGSKIGIHTLQQAGQALPIAAQAKARGFRIPLIKAVDNGGVAIDAKKLDPGILTMTRIMNPWDSAQGIEAWPAQQIQDLAKVVVNYCVSRLNAEERAAANWIEVLNEADPPGIQGWRNFGVYLKAIALYASSIGVKVAMPAFNYGTPEWAEMLAFLESGVLETMYQGGHCLTIHEAMDPGGSAPLAYGPIPGAPSVQGAGPLAWRYRYLNAAAKSVGQHMPNIVISEFYAGGGYNPSNTGALIERFKQYDTEIRKDDYVLALCPFTLSNGEMWKIQDYTFLYPAILDYMQSIKDFPNIVPPVTQPPPSPVPSPVWSPKVCLVGVHGRADGRNQPADFAAMNKAQVEAVFLMSSATPQEAKTLTEQGKFVMVRLFETFQNRVISPADFVSWHIATVHDYAAAGVQYFQIHNEPNLIEEGFGSSWKSGIEFSRWFVEVRKALKTIYPSLYFGFPGVSPGPAQAGVRSDERLFLSGCVDALEQSDFIGVHCYWADSAQQVREDGGDGFKYFRRAYPNKLLFITEFANPWGTVSMGARALQYVNYYKRLRNEPMIGAAFSFVVSASAIEFSTEAWRNEAGVESVIPSTIGANMSTITGSVASTATATHTITATALNVRQFPWVGTVEPSKMALLPGGTNVRVYAVVKYGTMTYGWGLISPQGNQWVSMQYLKVLT